MGFIYKITNKVNNKCYIGQTTKTVQQRFQRHLTLAKQHKNRYLYDAMNYYGYNNFKVTTIEECESSILNTRERYWIQYYHSNNPQFGYNMTEGGDGGDTWSKNNHKELTLQRIKSTKLKNGTWGKGCPKDMPSPRKGVYLVPINKDELLRDLQQGKSNIELTQKYNVGKVTLIQRCKDYFNQTPDQIRGIRLTPEQKELKHQQHLKDLSNQRKENWTGQNNPNYKNIDFSLLEKLLYEDYTLDEISEQLKLSKPTIINKIKQHYNMTTRELRKYVKSRDKTT